MGGNMNSGGEERQSIGQCGEMWETSWKSGCGKEWGLKTKMSNEEKDKRAGKYWLKGQLLRADFCENGGN